MTVELNSRHVIWSELDRELEKVNFPPEWNELVYSLKYKKNNDKLYLFESNYNL
jgi:hypothetical protein